MSRTCSLGVQHDAFPSAFRYNRRTLHTVSKDDSAALSGKAESVQSRKLSATRIAKKEEAAASRVPPQNVDRGPYRLAL